MRYDKNQIERSNADTDYERVWSMGKFLPTSLLAGLLILCVPASDAMAAAKRALLIGINEYKANDPDERPASGGNWIPEDLQGAVNDISLMEQVLTSRFGFEKRNIQRLEDKAATRAAILDALRTFVADTAADDIVYIHFSGHGSQVEDFDGDEEDGLDETILSHDARTGDIPDITDDELNTIFAGLASPNSLVVLDSCHSGTATRGASVMRARSVPLDPRDTLYRGPVTASVSQERSANYLLMTGAAAYQSALDGPLEEGQYYGLFTLSLGRSLGRVPQGASAADLHAEARREMERIGAEFGLFAVPEAQLEGEPGRIDQGILGESRALASRSAARLAWVPAERATDGRVLMRGARALAARKGSIWALYPPGESQFLPGAALGMLTIVSVQGEDAVATPSPGLSIESGSRAVQLLDATPDKHVRVRLDRVPAAQRESLAAALSEVGGGHPVEIVEGIGFARFIVDQEDGQYIVYGAGGLQRVAEFPANNARKAASHLVKLASRSVNVNELLALDNAASGVRISARVNPTDQWGGVRGVAVVGASDAPAYRVRRRDETRDPSNSLILEVETSEDAYLTIVDIDPEGNVAILFPNALSQQNGFYRDGLVPGGEAVRIPDGLENNRAGFNWDFVPPLGIDTLRIFAARDLATAERIRDYVAQVGTALTQRGGSDGDARQGLFSYTAPLQSRGIQTTPAKSGATGDWAATTVNLVIEE